MNDFDTADIESIDGDLDERDVRALTEYLTVLEDIDRARGAEDVYLVVSQSGSEYLVDLRFKSCECPDSTHRDVLCKHIRRAEFAVSERPLPAWVDLDDVAGELGEHVTTEQVAATDGGVVADESADAVETSEETYTYHREPEAQGGARYVRCEACGAECVPADPDRLYHRDGCSEGDR